MTGGFATTKIVNFQNTHMMYVLTLMITEKEKHFLFNFTNETALFIDTVAADCDENSAFIININQLNSS